MKIDFENCDKSYWIDTTHIGNWACPCCRKSTVFTVKDKEEIFSFCPFCGTPLKVREEDIKTSLKYYN